MSKNGKSKYHKNLFQQGQQILCGVSRNAFYKKYKCELTDALGLEGADYE